MVHDFEAAYREDATPWEIDGPQPEFVRLAEANLLAGPVLDVGCGTGENALLLAARGLEVLGVDASPTAIERARAKATARELRAFFHPFDALALDRLRRAFPTVIDSGLFHAFEDPERRLYRDALAAVTAPGSDVWILCFSDAEPPGRGPRRVAEHELRDAFRGPFAVMDIAPARFARRGGVDAKAWLTRLTRI